LKRTEMDTFAHRCTCRSIHPQGWVPIETPEKILHDIEQVHARSIHPQGWVPIETPATRSATSTTRCTDA